MKPFLVLVTLAWCVNVACAQSTTMLLRELDSLLTNRTNIANGKVQRIQMLKGKLTSIREEFRFSLVENILDEYQLYEYDSAFAYALQLQVIARRERNAERMAMANVRMAAVLVSSGLLNEALDTLRSVNANILSVPQKKQYYYLMVRTCYDLADFSQRHYYGMHYAHRGERYVDSASMVLPAQSFEYKVINGLRLLHRRNLEQARIYYESLLNDHPRQDNQFAIIASTLSFIYAQNGNHERSKELLIKAAIADARAATREAIALVKLAEQLYYEGDVARAYRYIQVAKEEAEAYGGRLRRMQVASVYPAIEGAWLMKVDSKRKLWLVYSTLITISLIVIVSFISVIRKKNKSLLHVQQQLKETNRIKEEYLWYYFNTTADYLGKLDAFKKTIENKLLNKKLDEIKNAAQDINIKRERDELFHQFDIVFIKLFPDFVSQFNTLLKEEHRIAVKEGDAMPVEMRIFALLRLGIDDHEKIAKILDYSLTTIYTYKTRIKSKAIVSAEEFEQRLLNTTSR